MTITNGLETMTLSLYPLSRPHSDIENTPWWFNANDFDHPINPILTINTSLELKTPQEDKTISSFIQNLYDSSISFGEYHAIYYLEIIGKKGTLWKTFVLWNKQKKPPKP